jgi:cell division initiation protein
MPYTPVELRHVRVPRSFLGYKRSAVQALLKEVADNFETAWRERHELADHVETIEAEIQQLRQREQALTQTLLAAEQAAAHVKEQAQREAELILAEAHNEARAVTRNAESECRRLEAETRRIEAILRGALGMLREGTAGEDELAEQDPGWPEREENEQESQPQLRTVSGGFDWGA